MVMVKVRDSSRVEGVELLSGCRFHVWGLGW